jgi:hypothetical protein
MWMHVHMCNTHTFFFNSTLNHIFGFPHNRSWGWTNQENRQ